MSKKKHHHEEHEEHVNHEAWVIPYADMLTLLMALFLVLWSMGQTDASKVKQVTSGFADSLGMEGNGSGVGGQGVLDGAISVIKDAIKPQVAPTINQAFKALEQQNEMVTQQQQGKEALRELQETITQQVQAAGLSADLDLRVEARGLVVSIVSEGVLFDAGSATLLPAGLAVLDRLAGSLASMGSQISVEGHTDDRPINTSQFPSNMYLSTARASSVVEYLASRGLDRKLLSAAGYADTRPRVPNTDDASRAENRRVDIAILAPVPELPVTEAGTVEPDAAPASMNEKMSQPAGEPVDTASGRSDTASGSGR